MELHQALAQEEAQLLQRVSSSVRVLSERYSDLRSKYPDKYVALHHGEPVAVGRTLDEVISAVRKARLAENEILVEFLPASDSALVV